MGDTGVRATATLAALSVIVTASPATASAFLFSSGNPDGAIATLSRPDLGGVIENETGDDFVLGRTTMINSATFTGLVTGAAPGVGDVTVEIYRVFPEDSDVGNTTGAPTFSTSQAPTRVNSPSDVAFESRDSSGGLTFSATTLAGSFTAANSVVNGINPQPNVFTGGEGTVTGAEDLFSVDFTTPLLLPAGHYFFVPQVEVTGGEFLWLSAPRPIVAPGTPFPAGSTDLQAWIRNENLAPDWLRVGTDITHAGPFNMTFSLTGATVPEPATWALMILGLGGVGAVTRRRRALAELAGA
jgi:hypothetical protein